MNSSSCPDLELAYRRHNYGLNEFHFERTFFIFSGNPSQLITPGGQRLRTLTNRLADNIRFIVGDSHCGMEREFRRLAEKLCKEKACKIQYCLQSEYITIKYYSTLTVCTLKGYK